MFLQLDMILKSKTKSLTRCPFCNANPFKSNVKSELAIAKKGRHESIRRIGNWHFWGGRRIQAEAGHGRRVEVVTSCR